MSALPSSVNYVEPLPSIPEGTSRITTVSVPINGSSFVGGQLIIVDLLKRGFIVPDSIYLRYKCAITGGITTAPAMVGGMPALVPFQKFETLVGSQNIDTINNYGMTSSVYSNLTIDMSARYGLQSCLGYGNDIVSQAITDYDGKVCNTTAGETFFVATPFPCLLTNATKLIPAFGMPQIRLQFTLDTNSNMFAIQSGATLTISNFEVCYDIVDLGSEVERHVSSLGSIYLKSHSYYNSVSPLPNGVAGSYTIPFNVQFNSVKSLIATFGGTSSASVNKNYDSYDPTSNNGDMCFTINGIQFPQRVLSTTINKSAFLQELRKITGSIYGGTNNLAINWQQYNVSGNATTTSNNPGKFYCGVDTEKITHSSSLLTGSSTGGSAILLNLNIGTATPQAYNVNMIVNFDSLLQIDFVNGNVAVVK